MTYHERGIFSNSSYSLSCGSESSGGSLWSKCHVKFVEECNNWKLFQVIKSHTQNVHKYPQYDFDSCFKYLMKVSKIFMKCSFCTDDIVSLSVSGGIFSFLEFSIF